MKRICRKSQTRSTFVGGIIIKWHEYMASMYVCPCSNNKLVLSDCILFISTGQIYGDEVYKDLGLLSLKSL